MARAAAARYARALADIATAPGAEADPRGVAEELSAFEAALASSADLRNILLSPAVAPARKRAVVGRIGASLALSRLVRNFLFVVIDHRRIEMLGQIRAAYEAALDERLGVARADITSAAGLTEAERQAIAAQLGRLSGRRIRPEFAVDAALIGGVSAKIGSTIYDGSVRGRLQALRRKMTAG